MNKTAFKSYARCLAVATFPLAVAGIALPAEASAECPVAKAREEAAQKVRAGEGRPARRTVDRRLRQWLMP